MSRLKYLLTYYWVLVGIGFMAACLGPALPSLAAQLGTDLKGVSVVLALRPFGYMIGSFLSGRLIGRHAGHLVMGLAVVLATVTLFLIPLSPSLAVLTVVIALMGFADGTLDVGCNTLLPWVYGKEAGPYFNGLHFAFGLGAFVTPLLMVWAMGISLNWAFWLLAILVLPAAPALFLIKSPTHEPEAVEAGALPKLDAKATLLIAAIFFFYGGSEAAFGNWIFSYTKVSGLGAEETAGQINSAFWGALALGRLAAVWIAFWAPLGAVLAVDAVGCVASLALMLAWPGELGVIWAGSLGTGLFMASFFPTLMAWAMRTLSPDGRVPASITAYFFVGASLGNTSLPWLTGQGFERLGPRFALQVIFTGVTLMALLLGLLYLTLKKTRAEARA